jgi:EAL domain-containing protein (putative c-di-GMP-specific phosphodiesterase class I)
LRERVLAHPTLGNKCRFDARGRAYAEIDARRLGSLTTDILERHGASVSASGLSASPGAMSPEWESSIAQRAYHGAIRHTPSGAAVVSERALRVCDDAPDAEEHGEGGYHCDVAGPMVEALDHLDDAVLIDADRVLRAVHAVNFFLAGRSPLLFLPVHDRLLKSIRYDHGKHFAQLLISLGLSPARIVIEIPPASSAHKTFLGYLLRSYRSYGFKVAAYIDDAGRVLSLDSTAMPDFIVAHAHSALRDGVVRPLVRFGALTKVRVVFAGVANLDESDRLTAMGATYLENSIAHNAGATIDTGVKNNR